MKFINKLALFLLPIGLWANPISYDPFELTYYSSVHSRPAWFEHRGVPLMHFTDQVGEHVFNIIKKARIMNKKIMIHHDDSDMFISSPIDIEKHLQISSEDNDEVWLAFYPKDVRLKKQSLLSENRIALRFADDWHTFYIVNKYLVEPLKTVLNSAKKQKTSVLLNITGLQSPLRQIELGINHFIRFNY